MCLQTFIAISQKLYPVGLSKIRAHKMKNKLKKLVHNPLKLEVRSLSSMYYRIELGAHNFSPETVHLHRFRFLHNI